MKEFNLDAALNGEPVRLRDGRKAIIYHRVPDIYTHKNGVKVTYPVVGMTFNTDGTVDNPCAAWMANGRFTSSWCGKDIVGMYEEPKISIEDLPKPFKPKKMKSISTLDVMKFTVLNMLMILTLPFQMEANAFAQKKMLKNGLIL